MFAALVTSLFFTACGFGVRHVMAKEEARRAVARELYIGELQEDVANLAAIVALQTEKIDSLRDEASDIIHESDMLLEAVDALKAANRFLLETAEKNEAAKTTKAKPVKVSTLTMGKRVRIRK